MKKILFAALAATVLFASCAKENSTQNPEVAGEAAKLSIVFDNPIVEGGTRAYDNTVETTIKSATIIVMNGESVGSKIDATAAQIAAPTTEYPVTTAATKIIVVANVASTAFTATNLTDLKKELAQLENMDYAANGFYASGTSKTLNWALATTANDGTSKKIVLSGADAITCKLLPAKLNVKVINSMSNYTGTAGTVLNDVAVLYSGAYSYWLAGTDNSNNFQPTTAHVAALAGTPKYFRSGFTGWASETSAQDAVYASLLKPLSASKAAASGAFDENTFYVYPPVSGAYSKNMILVVRASYNDGTSTVDKYFPVHFNGTDKELLQSGKQYTLTVTLKGDAGTTGGGGGGTGDPEEEIISAYISATVTIAAWEAMITLDKEFN